MERKFQSFYHLFYFILHPYIHLAFVLPLLPYKLKKKKKAGGKSGLSID